MPHTQIFPKPHLLVCRPGDEDLEGLACVIAYYGRAGGSSGQRWRPEGKAPEMLQQKAPSGLGAAALTHLCLGWILPGRRGGHGARGTWRWGQCV